MSDVLMSRLRLSRRWTWSVAALASVVALFLVLLVVFFSGARFDDDERAFARLFWASVVMAALLLAVVLWVVVRMVRRARQGRFGSRLLIKLAAIFGLVGILPGVIIYAVSWQFTTRSLESWFDQKVATALDAGVALGRGTLDALRQDLGDQARSAADRLVEAGSTVTVVRLERFREQLGAQELSVVTEAGRVLLTVGGASSSLPSYRPTASLIRQARQLGLVTQVEGLDSEAAEAHVMALVPLPDVQISLSGGEGRLLWVVQAIPRVISQNALAVQSAYSDYQQRALARDALRRVVLGTLTLALVLSVFGAVLLAIVLGNQITRPLIVLAEGVREVAAGNLARRPVFPSGDELGGLTRSFADMTEQVAQARTAVEVGVQELDAARHRLQTILDKLTAGVIVFDADGRVRTVNPGARRILGDEVAQPDAVWLSQVTALEPLAQVVRQEFERLGHAMGDDLDEWQASVELPGPAAVTTTAVPQVRTLLARGARLSEDERLLVFDDISGVVSAQRAQAWAEVARRVAHEIKNPLTPIQLSAERLQHKLEAKLEGADQAMLVRSVATIVKQVDAMKRLVNEFRDFARMPAAQLQPLSLNDLVQEVLGLYGQALEMGVLQVRLTEGLPRIMGDGAQLRQVVHNLIQNALDAVSAQAVARVDLSTAWVRSDADSGPSEAVQFALQDNGPGFADDVLKRAFEPYVTTKSKGTGLGLAVVKKITDEHGARIRVRNWTRPEAPDGPPAGARVSISFFSLEPSSAERPSAA
jgi:nitrogen fixation/metabolism regulation signal transduction histidine kinase